MESQPQNPEFRINPENFHPCSISSIQNMVQKEISLDEFQDGSRESYLGYWNRMILAVLNLGVA